MGGQRPWEVVFALLTHLSCSRRLVLQPILEIIMTSSVQQTRSATPRSPSKHQGGRGIHRQFYEDYITSTRWEKRKAAYYANHERLCVACKCTEDIHLHHHTYKRLGNEMDDDLVPLCQDCHGQVHRLHKEKGGTLTRATTAFLKLHDATLRPKRIKQVKPPRRRGPKAGPARPKRGQEVTPYRFEWAEGPCYKPRSG